MKGIEFTIRHVKRENPGGSLLILGGVGGIDGLGHLTRQGYRTKVMGYIAGLAELKETCYEAVLVNIEPLGRHTVRMLAGLKAVRPGCRIGCYGAAWSESQLGLEEMEGVVFWPTPVGAEQIERFLRGESGPPSTHPAGVGTPGRDGDERLSGALAARDYLWRLSQEIPNGLEAVIQSARDYLRRAFKLENVTITLREDDADELERNGKSLVYSGEVVGWLDCQKGLRGGEIPGVYLDLTATVLELARRDQALRELSTRDELTGAYNRRYLEHFVQQIIEGEESEPPQATLLIFDIDDFKQYNDQYGHSAGDEILCEVTRMIRHCCREHDIVARFGGDEFIVLFWDTGEVREDHSDKTEAYSGGQSESHDGIVTYMCNRFRRMIASSEFSFLGPRATGRLSISGGVARYPRDGKTLESLLEQADKALLEAKRQGKNRIYIAGEE